MKLKIKIGKALNDAFAASLKAAFNKQYNIEITTEYSIFSGSLITRRVDNKKLTRTQHNFIRAYEIAWSDAIIIISNYGER
jgi:hypothetical protein